MGRSTRWFVVLVGLLVATHGGEAAVRDLRPATTPARPGRGGSASTARLPLLFVENAGQTDERVALYAKTPSGTAYLTPDGITWGLLGKGQRWGLKFDFVGARKYVRPEGEDTSGTTVSYLKGKEADWHAGLRSWRAARYRDLWPGIDLVHETRDGHLKYSFELDAGADPSDIRLDVRGAPELRVDAGGRLVATTPVATYVDDRPVAWQETPDGRRDVAVAFDLDDRRLGFRVASHDPSLPLVIDPPTVVYASAFGGAGADFAGGIAVDDSGNAYITGRTTSDETTFPVTPGLDPTFNGGDFSGFDDAFVAKINPAGDGFVYVTYLGGTKRDWGTDIEVDAAGAAYVCGLTASKTDFPTLVGPDLTHGGGFDDGFVVKLNPAGTELEYGGFIGGVSDPFGGDEAASGLDLDETGRAYVVGTTAAATGFPTAGGLDATHNGGSDVFVVVVAADGSGFEQAGFLGGPGNETGNGIAVGPGHSIYVCGKTTAASFPAVVGPSLAYGGGTEDAICARFDATGAVQWAGFWGGALVDNAQAIDVDAQGNAYLAGFTTSSELNGFPVVNATDGTANGSFDACIAQVKADGTGYDFSTFLGGGGSDVATGIVVASSGVTAKRGSTKDTPSPNVIVVSCNTASVNFPATARLTPGGAADLACVVFDAAGSGSPIPVIRSATQFGTLGDDSDGGVAFDASLGLVWNAGGTFSDDLTGHTTLGGTGAAPPVITVTKIDVGSPPTVAEALLVPTDVTVFQRPSGSEGLIVNAALDFGIAGVNPDAPITVFVKGIEFTVLSIFGANGPGLTFSTPPDSSTAVDVTVTQPKSGHGSSRLDVQIRVAGDLSNLFAPGDTIAISLQQTVTASAQIEIPQSCPSPQKKPCNPRKRKGSLVEPGVAPTGFSGLYKGPGKDRFRGNFKLGDLGDLSTAPTVKIDVGNPTTTIEFPGDTAKKQGNSWVYTGPGSGGGGAGLSATVRLNAINKTMTIDAKGVTFGDLPPGRSPVDVKVKVGDAETRFRANINRLGKRIYW